MLHAAPAHVGDVQQAVEAIEVHKHAEVRDVLHAANAALPLGDRGQQVALLVCLAVLHQLAARDDDVAALGADLDDLELKRLVDVRLDIMYRSNVDLRTGQEGFDAIHVHNQAAAHAALDDAIDHGAFVILGQHGFPAELIVGLALAQRDHAIFAFELHQQDIDAVADLNRGDVVEFVGRDHTFGLVADIDQHFATADGADDALDDRAGRELAHGGREGGVHCVIHRAGLIDSGHGSSDCHVKGSETTGSRWSAGESDESARGFSPQQKPETQAPARGWFKGRKT